MRDAGAQTTTIPDTLPATNTLRGAAQEVSNAPGGEALYRKLAGRDEGDIALLLGSAKRDAQQAAVPNVSPINSGPAADALIADVAAKNRTAEMMPILQKAPLIPRQNVRNVIAGLESRTTLPQNAGTDDARYMRQAAQTIDGMPQYEIPMPVGQAGPGAPGVNQQALSKVVKSLDAVDSQIGGPAGQVLKNQAAVGAAKEASSLLKQESPEYARAMQVYAKNTPQVELARLLAEKKLRAIPNTASSSLTTDTTREELASALAKINPAVGARVGEKLMAADQLAKLRPQQGVANMEAEYGNTMLGTLLTPFSSAARASNRGMRLRANEQLSELLANPTGANYQTLIEMSKIDPSITKMMANMGNVGSLKSVSQTQGSAP